MWWGLLLAIVAWTLFRFFSDWNTEGKRVASDGGMQNKYSTIVNWALEGSFNSRIIQESRTFIRIGASSAGGSTFIDINHTFSTVTIQWISKSIAIGNDKLEWEFDVNYS